MNSTLKPRVLNGLLPDTTQKKLLLITGARQTGKSTLVQGHYPALTYINLDAFETRNQLQQISTFDWAKTLGSAIIDEAQKEPAIFEKIKYAFDKSDLPFTVLLGSSQILMLKQIRESLAGRVSIYELFSLMTCEILATDNKIHPPLLDMLLGQTNIEDLLQTLPPVLFAEANSSPKNAENYLLMWGGMPRLIYLTDEEKKLWLADYEYTYLERDLADLAKISDLLPFQKLQRLTALRSGKLLNFSELARDIGISVDTVRRYIEYLRLSYQTILLQPFFTNQTTSAIKTPKLYWLDIGILRYLTGFWGEPSGELFETFIVSEIYKWVKTRRQSVELFFYRTRNGVEIDLILKIGQKYLGIEIKSRTQAYLQDAKNLQKFAHEFSEDWLGGLVVYRGEILKKIAEPNIWAIPSWRLLT
jgi:hypothetical protein